MSKECHVTENITIDDVGECKKHLASLSGLDASDIDMDEIIEFSELGEFIDYPVRTYSSGMHSKLAFSISSVLESDIILVDEVLGVGDQHFKKKSYARLMEMINDKKHTVLIVSHTVSRLAKLCDRIMWLENGKIRKIGDPKEIIQEYLTEEGIEEEF